MGDLKPIGSEKLQGDDKIKRILELTYFNQKSSNTKQSKVAELVKESANGTFGIVKEKDGYYVKKGLNEQSLDYIGGLFMKNKNRFNSYAEALKRLELLKSQELHEDVTKYVLKANKPKEEAPLPQAPIDDAPPAPVDDVPAMDTPADAPVDAPVDAAPESEPEMSPEESKRSDYMAEVQKYAGKLGQELRDQQIKMESDDIKYVLNMIISAVDLDKLDDEDIEDIAKKFDRDEEEAAAEPMGDEPVADEEPAGEEPEQTPEDDLAERISKLEELINSKIGDDEEQSLEEFYFFDDEEQDEVGPEHSDEKKDDGLEKKFDSLDITPELNDINESINTTLSKYFE